MIWQIKKCCSYGDHETNLFRIALRLNNLDDSYGIWYWNTCPECRAIMIKNGLSQNSITEKQSWIFIEELDEIVDADIVHDTSLLFDLIKRIKQKKKFLDRIEKK